MREQYEFDFEVVTRCDCCLNPIAVRQKDNGDLYNRWAVSICGKLYCGHCAPLVGVMTDNRFFDRNDSQPFSWS